MRKTIIPYFLIRNFPHMPSKLIEGNTPFYWLVIRGFSLHFSYTSYKDTVPQTIPSYCRTQLLSLLSALLLSIHTLIPITCLPVVLLLSTIQSGISLSFPFHCLRRLNVSPKLSSKSNIRYQVQVLSTPVLVQNFLLYNFLRFCFF